jgi:hypothetical protein
VSTQTTGRLQSEATVRNEVRRALHGHAGQLATKTLAKALAGDTTAQLACVQLLALTQGKK